MTLRNYTSAERKEIPMWSVLSAYFPDAFAALARHAKKANDKHNPGEPMHWAREKSKDNLECAVRHLATPFEVDPDTNEVELVGAFWRIGAELQLFEEKRLVAAGIRPLSGVVPAMLMAKPGEWVEWKFGDALRVADDDKIDVKTRAGRYQSPMTYHNQQADSCCWREDSLISHYRLRPVQTTNGMGLDDGA